MSRVLLALGALVLLGTSACSSSSMSASAQPTLSRAPDLTVTACPALDKARFTWPVEVPADLPQPPAATFGQTTRTKDGLTIVKFTTETSLQQGVLFVVKEVQKAGFTIGRGDAEPTEADAPFGRGDLRGIYKMVTLTGCRTQWLVAVTSKATGTGSPILPMASRGPSSQPLPFG